MTGPRIAAASASVPAQALAPVLAAALGLCALLGMAAPAEASGDFSIAVSAVDPGTIRMTGSVSGAASTSAPPVTATLDGTELQASAQVVQAAQSQAERRAVVVLIDTSGSMIGAPLQAARTAAMRYASAMPADIEIGVVTIAHPPAVALAPTGNRTAVAQALTALAARGDTALYAGLRQAAGLLAGYAERRVVVLSDGRDTRSANQAAAATRQLATAKIPVDVVAFHAQPEGLARMRGIASATGGRVYEAANPAALAGAFQSAASTIDLHLAIVVTVPSELAGRSGILTVTAEVAGASRTASASVQLPGSGRAGVAAGNATSTDGDGGDRGSSTDGAAVRPRPFARGGPALVLAMVFCAVLAMAMVGTGQLRRGAQRGRLEQIDWFRPSRRAPADPALATAGEHVPWQRPVAQRVVAMSERIVRSRGAEGRIALRLECAGISVRPAEWVVLRACATLTGLLLGWAMPGLPWGIACAGLAWASLGGYRRVLRARRVRAFGEQLPDALQLVVGSLRSGFSLVQAVNAVTMDAAGGPLAAEFRRALCEARLGVDLSEALDRVAARVDNSDLAWAVMAIRIQRDSGGNLAEILETTVRTIRDRARLRRHVRALSAEGRLSGYILVALPVAVTMWMVLVRREYISLLWTTPIGIAMAGGSIVMVAIGAFWMSRCARVEV